MQILNNHIPKKINKYHIGQIIGKGAFGFVYRGLDKQNGNLVAIKVIQLAPDKLKIIQEEIQLLKKLDNPNIVKYIDCFQSQGIIYIFLQYIENGSLSNMIRKYGSLTQQLTAKYIKQVLQGLNYLHNMGVVHRDIKGPNILTTKDGIVKVADFGVAVHIGDQNRGFTAAGTSYWMAPEVIRMQQKITITSDIWSVGCLTIQLITGKPPYFNLNPCSAAYRMVQDIHPPLPQQITCSCRNFLLRCFNKNPYKRPTANELLKDVWLQQNNMEKEKQSEIERVQKQKQNYQIENIESQQEMFKSSMELYQILDRFTGNDNQMKLKGLQELIKRANQKDESLKYLIYNQNFIQFLEVIDSQDDQLKFLMLKFFNHVVPMNKQIIDYVCILGYIPKLFKLTRVSCKLRLRQEIAFFIRQLINQQNKLDKYIQLFMGDVIQAINNFMLNNYKNNKQLISCSIEIIEYMLNQKLINLNHLIKIFSSRKFVAKLVYLSKQIYDNHQVESSKFLKKLFSILKKFSKTKNKMVLLSFDCYSISVLFMFYKQYFLDKIQMHCKIIMLISSLSTNQCLKQALQNNGIIPTTLNFLNLYCGKQIKIKQNKELCNNKIEENINEIIENLVYIILMMSNTEMRKFQFRKCFKQIENKNEGMIKKLDGMINIFI